MKRPVVNYKEFRLKKINEPQYAHLKYLLGWVGYFVLFYLTETYIPAEACHSVHCWLDDVIPFCEYFLIPYVFWYGLIVITLVYFALYNTEGFKRFMTFIIVTQVTAITIYILFPSRQDLRPTEFARDNIFTFLVGKLYAFDTNTGVCPSLHVAYSIGIMSAWLKEHSVSSWWKCFVVIAAILICLSTMFIKQHSALDFLAALPVCFLAEIIAYRKPYWAPRINNHIRSRKRYT